MAYTPSARRQKQTGGFVSNYASVMQSQDATASPVTSPVTNMSGSGVALTVPATAVRFYINSTVAVQVGEDSSYAQGFTVPAAATKSFDCARQQFIYVKPSSGTNTTQFYFELM